ncbi:MULTISPECIES: aromatic amino acid transaminase [Sphingobacterium]|uniref:amino acid aminotransferase n=1 Tax=Sphingobacterium TaxID=28453 RepID=UPI0010534ED1|nr:MULTISPECIES: amino acid aminotransferase [Sphingobacterium]MCW2263084.1 aromatic-amino-acid transaminase [Sphingobacterium kitahiroshimense]TCR11932.1 aromatic-amino-acid transaminase [Sphingobacterium sp. JUb78]
MFKHIEHYAGDPILSLMDAYNNDPRTDKVNLSIGLYYNERGETPVMDAVSQAKNQIKNDQSSLYLPMSGMPSYCQHIQHLLFAHAPQAITEKRITTIQTLGGSGALKVGADFLKKSYPTSKVYVSRPTWENHISIFNGAGFTVEYYPYFNDTLGTLDFNAMITFLSTLEESAIVLLHPCCHNPTGADLTKEQWDETIKVLKFKKLIPFLDMAYQGFGKGFNEDLYAITAMTNAGLTFLLSNSFSKIFSLYGERVGGLSVVCTDKEEANLVAGQLKATVRKNYSSPPTYGAKLIDVILGNPELKQIWLIELESMRIRMKQIRKNLYSQIIQLGGEKERFSFLIDQTGMFSYSGFSPKQVHDLREEYAIYLVKSGRICIAGLNEENIARVAQAFLSVNNELVVSAY